MSASNPMTPNYKSPQQETDHSSYSYTAFPETSYSWRHQIPPSRGRLQSRRPRHARLRNQRRTRQHHRLRHLPPHRRHRRTHQTLRRRPSNSHRARLGSHGHMGTRTIPTRPPQRHRHNVSPIHATHRNEPHRHAQSKHRRRLPLHPLLPKPRRRRKRTRSRPHKHHAKNPLDRLRRHRHHNTRPGEERSGFIQGNVPDGLPHGSHKETSTHTPKHSSEAATPEDSTGTETSTETGNSPNHGDTHQSPSQHYS